MKKENKYYIDENNNKWNIENYTEAQAIELSETLVGCFNMIDCRDCRYCSDCSSCNDCREFKENPQRYTSSEIGSRSSQTTIYWNNEKTQVVCGCFNDTLSEFTAKVELAYKKGEYREQYDKFIETCNYLIKQ